MTAWERVLRQLLPPGRLFDELPDDADLAKLLRGLALEFDRTDARARDLTAEMDPRYATETLDAWERVLRLPDTRVPELPGTVAGRRAVITAKLVMRGAQHPDAYFALVAAAGWELLELKKAWTLQPLRVNDRVNDRVYGAAWANVVEFRVGNPATGALPIADLTRLLQHTLQAHAYGLVTEVP